MNVPLLFAAALSLAEPHPPSQEGVRQPRHRMRADAVSYGPSTLLVYPVAGEVAGDGGDFTIPYYVDVEPASPAFRDFNCGSQTFDGHTGHDPYIRSFAEQRIGVPVFAVLDGTVIELHDGEPDENTDNSSLFPANYIVIRHANDQVSHYSHLKRNSITHRVGDFVSAGTQIGLVGSSGSSLAPHIHFEFRYRGEVVEPMAGPCRPGPSFFTEQPPLRTGFTFIRGTLSKTSFANVRPAPHDDAPPIGTFRRGQQTFHYKVDVANVSSSITYELYVERPNGTRIPVSDGFLVNHSTALAAVFWKVDVDLNTTGNWHIVLEINGGQQTFRRPFNVVATSSEIVNRPPGPVSATIAPFTLGEVPVCRVSGDPLADPDYDVVSYRYQWHVGGALVRDVTSAARADALARNLLTSRAVSCTVTVSDNEGGTAQPAVAHAEAGVTRRRSVRSR
ncbi:MAG TPA: M23 family metallopeptidase [Thermoanaerobaculia bacterium]|jgi:hypothetical protein